MGRVSDVKDAVRIMNEATEKTVGMLNQRALDQLMKHLRKIDKARQFYEDYGYYKQRGKP